MGELSWKGWEGKGMIVNFVANYQAGYVGEVGDATHLAREMEALGHTVRKIPQDAWREYVIDGMPEGKYDVPRDLKANINIICKWHHFYDGSFIEQLRIVSGAPVFYWVWDYMDDAGLPSWHRNMVDSADLYLGNDIYSPQYKDVKNKYYFPFDVADGDIPRHQMEKKYDVVFFGSWLGQGDRIEYLTEINKTNPITVFSWNHEEWEKRGFTAHPAIYGINFARAVGQSRIILGLSVEATSWGYWSNRVGKVLTLGGFLLYQYAPGMEIFLHDGAEYFSSIEEAREKIDHYMIADTEREAIAKRGYEIGRMHFTSKARVKDLMILAERFLKKGSKIWKI